MTAAERLALLLPLANGDTLPDAEQRRHVFRFLQGFEARGLRLPAGEGELWDAHDATAAELAAVQRKVERVFFTAFLFEGEPAKGTENTEPDDIRMPLSFPSLRFGAFSPPSSRRRSGFTFIVEAGRLRDLVPYLAMWLLTTESIKVSRCTAPQRGKWKERCGRFVIWLGRGRPPKVCRVGKCAGRVKSKSKHAKYQAIRREHAALLKMLGKKGPKKRRTR
jgi:hypothetical protein